MTVSEIPILANLNRAKLFTLSILFKQGLTKLTRDNLSVVFYQELVYGWSAIVKVDLLEGTYYEVVYDPDNHRATIDVLQRYKSNTVTDELLDKTDFVKDNK